MFIGEVKRKNITFVIDNHDKYKSNYDSEKEKEEFLNYASEHFHRDYAFTRPPNEPSFPVSLPTNQMVDFFRQQYKDALIIVDMLANYRISQAVTIKNAVQE